MTGALALGIPYFTVDLDPTQPGLGHHRPGGFPLFGTAMGIDAMADAARPFGSIENIVIHAPCILTDTRHHRVAIRFDPPMDDARGRFIDCQLFSPAVGEPETLHFQARFRLEEAMLANESPTEQCDIAGVMATDIYQVFFHGPAFQVVASAQFTGAVVISKLAAQTKAQIPMSAQLIEFGLQTAGLLELALTDRMMIPDRIGRIVFADRFENSPLPVVAIARRKSVGTDTDIEVKDATGAPVMTISDYRTVSLPFPTAVNPSGLGKKLRAEIKHEE